MAFISRCCVYFVLFSLAAVGSAEAYIDPGTGSMIVQAVIAAVAAVGVSLGVFWRKIKSFFSKKEK